MNVRSYIPKHKLDYHTIDLLKTLKEDKLVLIMDDLIEWIRDIN
ncbi:DUF5071 domain-containing protein [Longirhabdus pacifica]